MKIYWDNIPKEIIGLTMDMDLTVNGWTEHEHMSLWTEDDYWVFTITEDGRDICGVDVVVLEPGVHYDIEENDNWLESFRTRPKDNK